MGNSKRSADGDGRGRGKPAGKARSAGSGKSGQRGKSVKGASKASASAGPDEAPTPSFESALERLEVSVARLEEGEMPLEEALELFESGVKLSRQCQSTLEEAERRIEILVADRGLTLEDQDEDGDEGDGIVDFDSGEDADDESAFEG